MDNNFKKIDFYNPETFEKIEIQTEIPESLVNNLKESLEKLSEQKYIMFPAMVNPDNKNIIFLLIDKNSAKYRITIEKIERNDD